VVYPVSLKVKALYYIWKPAIITMTIKLLTRRLFLIIIVICKLIPASAQDSLPDHYTDISKVTLVNQIGKNTRTAYANKNDDPALIYSTLDFFNGIRHKETIPNDFVTHQLILKFNICNTSDTTVSVYFFPGFYFKNIQLYKSGITGLAQIPSVLPAITDSIGYRQITLLPKDSATIIASLQPIKTYINTIRPRLINKEHLSSFILEIKSKHANNSLVTYVFCGLLLMMILFSVSIYFQGGNPEFLYYSLYAFLLGSMLFTKTLFDYHTNRLTFFFEEYLDFILQGLSIIFYMFFMQKFLETKTRHPFLHKLYNAGILLLVISLFSYTYLHYFTDNFSLENLVENLTKVLLLAMIIIFLFYSLRHWNDKLLRYLFWGNLFLLIFSVTSQVNVLMERLFKDFPGVFSSSIFYYEIGLFLELVFFLAGLNHKNRQLIIQRTKESETLKAQNLMQQYEKEIAVYKAQQEERERISADMHDELGSGMTAIRLMSEIARNKMKENTPVEIHKISQSADEVLNKMNAIIWSMNSSNDTLDNLVSYIRSYSLEYFENTPIECRVNTPESFTDHELTGDKRRNIFLCVKETLNNVLKHSEATLVTITIEIHESLKIKITDNGKGIDKDNLRRFGNGLKNIQRRMENIGGSFSISGDDGTVTVLELPL
jgi:signal transduction histidine kinase